MLDYQPNDGAQALDQQQQLDWQRGYQVINADSGSNLVSAPSSGGLAVDVAGGDILAGGSTVSCSPVTDLALPAADADQPRTDVIYRDAVGDVQVKRGVPGDISPGGVQARGRDAAAPSPYPMHDIDGVVLATVWVADGAASITSADIRDRRLPATLSVDQITASSVVADTMDANTVSTEKTSIGTQIQNNANVADIGHRGKVYSGPTISLNDGESSVILSDVVFSDVLFVQVVSETDNRGANATVDSNTVVLLGNSADWASSDSAGTHNLFVNNLDLTIKNQTGESQTYDFTIHSLRG